MNLDDVTVVTRTRNRPLLLGRAIESILGQTHSKWKHVIVNDCGDRAKLDDVVSKYSTRYDGRLTILDNTQPSTAANRLIRACGRQIRLMS